MALDDTFGVGGEGFFAPTTYLHMIGEYWRHNGRAELPGERIDRSQLGRSDHVPA
jgi:hypothetical protein